MIIDRDTVIGIRFLKGTNTIVVNVVNLGGEWGFSLRILYKAGKPIPGVWQGDTQRIHDR